MSSAHQKFVLAHILEGPVEKALVADVLRDLDIPYMIEDHHQDQLGTMLSPHLGAGRLMVFESDKAKVEGILKELKNAAELGVWLEE